MQKETIEISGDRKLYNYRFIIGGQELEPERAEEETNQESGEQGS